MVGKNDLSGFWRAGFHGGSGYRNSGADVKGAVIGDGYLDGPAGARDVGLDRIPLRRG